MLQREIGVGDASHTCFLAKSNRAKDLTEQVYVKPILRLGVMSQNAQISDGNG
jgi:hypothetical protein